MHQGVHCKCTRLGPRRHWSRRSGKKSLKTFSGCPVFLTNNVKGGTCNPTEYTKYIHKEDVSKPFLTCKGNITRQPLIHRTFINIPRIYGRTGCFDPHLEHSLQRAKLYKLQPPRIMGPGFTSTTATLGDARPPSQTLLSLSSLAVPPWATEAMPNM